MFPLLFIMAVLQAASAGAATTIVAFGDSLTAGYGVATEEAYPHRLQSLLRDRGYDCRVINAGRSGETSAGAAGRTGDILRLRPDIVIVETGINDLFRGIGSETTAENIRKIIRTFTERGITVLLAGFTFARLSSLDPEEKFTRIYPALAKSEKVPLIPFFLEGVAGIDRLNLSDGVHPNSEGYAIVAGKVLSYILPLVQAIEDRGRSPR